MDKIEWKLNGITKDSKGQPVMVQMGTFTTKKAMVKEIQNKKGVGAITKAQDHTYIIPLPS